MRHSTICQLYNIWLCLLLQNQVKVLILSSTGLWFTTMRYSTVSTVICYSVAIERRIYRITLFLIHLADALDCFLDRSSEIIMNSSTLLMTRLRVTYSWSWAKISRCRHRSTCCKDWPCDLLIIILKARRIGNWTRRNKAYRLFESDEAREIRDI